MILNKPHIFQDPKQQAEFDKNGYVVIDLISEDKARTIADIFYKHYPAVPSGFYAVAFNSNDNIKNEIFAYTDAVLNQPLHSYFKDFKKLGSTFLSKTKGEDGKVGVHQDWYVVDETKYYSATVWIPTEGADEQNGTLKVLPGSHLFFDTYRSNHIPVPYSGYETIIWDNMITVPVKAGQAFVLNHAVLHASAPNYAEKERLVIAYGIASAEASLHFYHQHTLGRVEHYLMPPDFFQKYYTIGQRPQFGQLLEELEYEVPACSLAEITYLIRQSKKISLGYEPGSPEIPLNDKGYLAIPENINEPRKKWLTVSIPAYNDEHSLLKLVEETQTVCDRLDIDVQILIINDGSTDNTENTAIHLSDKYKNVEVLKHDRNFGFGPTLKEVFTFPKTEWVLFLPGDNQFPASNIELLLSLRKNYDFILGKRKIRRDSILRLFYAGFYNRLVSWLSGYKVEDVNGIAFFKSAVFEKIQLRTVSSFIHAEFFLEAKRHGYNVAEIDVVHKEREFGKGSGGKWSVIIPSVIDLLRYLLKHRLF